METFSGKGAIFSEDRRYRYALWRIWDESKSCVMFIGLNPSSANERTDDPTIRRVLRFAYDWGFGGVYMMNLFAYVTPYPWELQQSDDATMNEAYLKDIGKKCSKVIFAWGSFDVFGRAERVKAMFPLAGALVINKNGTPRHPLYVKRSVVPVLFNSTFDL